MPAEIYLFHNHKALVFVSGEKVLININSFGIHAFSRLTSLTTDKHNNFPPKGCLKNIFK